MRKHIDYFYKEYDLNSGDIMEKATREKFNDYGYNFGSNSKTIIDYDKQASRTNYKKNYERLKNKTK